MRATPVAGDCRERGIENAPRLVSSERSDSQYLPLLMGRGFSCPAAGKATEPLVRHSNGRTWAAGLSTGAPMMSRLEYIPSTRQVHRSGTCLWPAVPRP